MSRKYRARNRPITFKRSVHLRGAVKGLKYPNCFYEHNAPRSVVKLFTGWVLQADITDNGIIPINLQHQKKYSNVTAQTTIKWLTLHNLIEKKSVGVGQGVASRYLIRWTFLHKSITDRQKYINSTDRFMQRLVTSPTIVEKLAFIQRSKNVNSPDNHSISASESNGFNDNLPGNNVYPLKSELKKPRHASSFSNKKPLSLIEKSVRYTLYRMREYTNDKDVITAVASIVRKKMKANKIFAGPEVNTLIDELKRNDYNNKPTRKIYAIVGQTVNDTIDYLDMMKGCSAKHFSVPFQRNPLEWINT